MLAAFWMSSAVPSTPSGPGWFCARVSTMNRCCAGRSSAVPSDVVRAGDQRVVGPQRHEHRAAALHGLVHPVVEELTEEREQRVVRRGETGVGRDVRE